MILGLISVISAIVFGILVYRYNQNNLALKTQEKLNTLSNVGQGNSVPNTNSRTNLIDENDLDKLKIKVQNKNQNEKTEDDISSLDQ